jgi:hypothetical protein
MKKPMFDSEQLRALILDRHGDVGWIAKKLHVDSEELRAFIYNSPMLTRAMSEVISRAVDKAVTILFEGLDDKEHYGNQLAAAKQVLKTRAAQKRGFHRAQDIEMRLPARAGALTLTWLPPGAAQEPPLIEGKVEK